MRASEGRKVSEERNINEGKTNGVRVNEEEKINAKGKLMAEINS